MKLSQIPTYDIAVLQSRSNRAFKTKMAKFLKDHQITVMQWSIIGQVSAAGKRGMRISDLATELDTSMAFITTTVNMLEAKKIVEKTGHERDSRAKVVRLSEAFQPKVKAIELELHKQISSWMTQHVHATDLGEYLQVLQALAKA